MTKIAFVADLHVDDYPGHDDAATGLNARFLDGLGIARWVAQDAHDRGCEVLVIGGDLTEKRHPAPWRVAMIAEAIGQFPGPVVIARGNHDGLVGSRSIADVLTDGRPEWHGFSRPGSVVVGDTAIAVLPYLDRHWLRAQPGMEAVPDADLYRILGEQFLAIARGLYAETTRGQHGRLTPSHVVLVVHQALSGGLMTEEQQAFLGDLALVVDTGALAAIGFDVVLAGHFHLHQVLSADPLVVYAGSPQRVSFQEETQTKGYLVVDTDYLPAFEFIETPARRFVTINGDDVLGRMAEDELAALACKAIVRVVDAPAAEVGEIREILGHLAFDVTTITPRQSEAAAPSGGLAESLAPAAALEEYFAGDDDRAELVALGGEILQAVA